MKFIKLLSSYKVCEKGYLLVVPQGGREPIESSAESMFQDLRLISLQIIDSSVTFSFSEVDFTDEASWLKRVTELKCQSSTNNKSTSTQVCWVSDWSEDGPLRTACASEGWYQCPRWCYLSLWEMRFACSRSNQFFHSSPRILAYYFYFLYSYGVFSLSYDILPRWGCTVLPQIYTRKNYRCFKGSVQKPCSWNRINYA